MSSLLSSLVDASKRVIPTSGTETSTTSTTPIPHRGHSRNIGDGWETLGLSPPSAGLGKERDDEVVSLDGDGKTREDTLAEQKELEDLRKRCRALEAEKEELHRARVKDNERNLQLLKELEVRNTDLTRERNELVEERDTLRQDLERVAADRNIEESRAHDLQDRLDDMQEQNTALSRAKAELSEENEALECHFAEERNALESRCKSLEKQNSASSQIKDELSSTKETVVWLTDQLKTKTRETEEMNGCFRVLEAIITGAESPEDMAGPSTLTENAKRLCAALKKKQDEQASARRHYTSMSIHRDNVARHLNERISDLSAELKKRDAELTDLQATSAGLREKNEALETSKRDLKERLERRKKRYDSVVEKLARYELAAGKGKSEA